MQDFPIPGLKELRKWLNKTRPPMVDPSVTYNNASVITIGPCAVWDDTGRRVIQLASNRTLSLTVSGPGGLDTGSEAANTWYYPWLIATANGFASAILSTSATNPVLPIGYCFKKRLDLAIRNDASSNIIPFSYTRPWVNYRNYDGTFNVLTGGQLTTWTDVPCASVVPPQSNICQVHFEIEAFSGVYNQAIIRPGGSSAVGKIIGVPANITGVKHVVPYQVDLDANRVFQYILFNGNTVLRADVTGYCWTS